MNGASEATLQELLQINQSMAESLAALAGRSFSGTSSTGSGTSSGSGAIGASTGALNRGFTALGTAVGVTTGLLSRGLSPAIIAASAAFSQASKSANVLYQNQLNLAEGAIRGTNSLASLTAGLEQLPGILGFAMKAYNLQTKKLEANIDIYQQISTVGARFGGSLEQVRQSAKDSYLSLDEFSRVMKAAAPSLRFMGETTEQGAKNLVKFNSTMIKSDVGKGLLGMGYTLEEANSMVGLFSQTLGGVTAKQLKDQNGMEKSVKAFAEELDLAAQLEGKTRQQKAEELKKDLENAAIQDKLSTMTKDQQLKYQMAIDAARATGKQGAVDAVNAKLLELAPTTKAGQIFQATMSDAANSLYKMVDAAKDNTTVDEARGKMTKLRTEAELSAVKSYRAMGKAAEVAAFTGTGELASQMQAGAQLSADLRNQQVNSEKDRLDQINKIRKEQETAQNSEVGASVQAQGRAKYFGDLMDRLAEILKPLTDIIVELNNKFLEILPTIVHFAKDVIDQVIKPVFTGLFGDINFDDIVKPFKDFFGGFFGASSNEFNFKSISTGIINFFKPIITFFGDFIKSIDFEKMGKDFRLVFDKLGDLFTSIGNTVGTIFSSIGKNGGLGIDFQNIITKFFDLLKGAIEIIGNVVTLFVQTDLFQTLKTYFFKIVKIVEEVIEVLVAIVNSPFGTWLATAITAGIDLFYTSFKFIIDAVEAVVDVIFGIVKMCQGDLTGGMEKILDGIGTLIKGIVDWVLSIPKFLFEIFGGSWKSIEDAIHSFIDGFIDALKGFFGKVINFFSKEKDKTEVPSPTDESKKIEGKKKEEKPLTLEQQAIFDKVTVTNPANFATPKNPETKQVNDSSLQKIDNTENASKKRNAELELIQKEKTKEEEAKKQLSIEPKIEKLDSQDPIELLRAEIKTLNNINTQLLKAMKETSDNTKSTANILARTGNLFVAR